MIMRPFADPRPSGSPAPTQMPRWTDPNRATTTLNLRDMLSIAK